MITAEEAIFPAGERANGFQRFGAAPETALANLSNSDMCKDDKKD